MPGGDPTCRAAAVLNPAAARSNELTLPDPSLLVPRRPLLVAISALAISGVVERPPGPHPAGVEIAPLSTAAGDPPAVPIPIALDADDFGAVHQTLERGGRVVSALPKALVELTHLPFFGGIDPPKSDPHISNLERIAVDHAGRTGEVGCSRWGGN